VGEVSEFPIKGASFTLQVILTEFISEETCSHPDTLKFFLGNKLVVVYFSVHALRSFAASAAQGSSKLRSSHLHQ